MKRNVGLWILQGLLAAVFLMAGGSKLVMTAEEMAGPGPIQLPTALLRFIGVCEVLGAIGMILPGLTGIRPRLTAIDGVCLALIMAGASVINVVNGMAPFAILTVVVGLMALYVAYGRWSVREAR